MTATPDPTPTKLTPDDDAALRLALRPREAAKALGVSERVLWSWTADRTSGIPFVRKGRCVLYPVRDLRDWLTSRLEK